MGGIALLVKQTQFKWYLPSLDETFKTLRGGLPLFLSSSAVSLYTASSSLILGFTSSREQVGYFGLSQRLVGAACSLLTPFNQILYPQANRSIRARAPEARAFVRNALFIQGGLGLALSFLLLCLGPGIISVVFGSSFAQAASSLRWIAALPLVIAIGSVFANLVMLPAHRDLQHLIMTSTAGALNVVLILGLAHMGATGAAIALLIAESFVALYAFRMGSRVLAELNR
jgi:O-antigen/teichoic acid export membrane protein